MLFSSRMSFKFPSALTFLQHFKYDVIIILAGLFLAIVPEFPNSSQNFTLAYFNIFFPVFIFGCSSALMDLGKISIVRNAIFGVLSFYLVMRNLQLFRLELYKFGPFISYGYAIFLVFYLLRNRMKGSQYTAWAASLTYSIYLTHKWLVPALQTLIDDWLKIFHFLVPTLVFLESTPSTLLIALFVYFLIINIFVLNIELPLLKWSKKFSLSKNA